MEENNQGPEPAPISPPAPTPVSWWLGLAGLITGIVAIITAVIPCLAWLGLILGLIGLVPACISLAQCISAKRPKGMAIAGIVCSGVAVIIAIVWVVVAVKTVTEIQKLDRHLDSVNQAMQQPLQALPPMDDTLNTQ